MSWPSGTGSPYDRLMARTVRTESGCLEFTGSRAFGYSRVKTKDRRNVPGHRIVMERALGHAIPDGLIVRHRCDNPPCVEIEHLELGTNADNSRDMRERGRAAIGSRVAGVKLTSDQAVEARALVAAGATQASVARLMGVSRSCIHLIVKNQNWRHAA